jgi:protein tyrosine phosphatase (PTP) superfamily phosphohydrolase (DUF442 family)
MNENTKTCQVVFGVLLSLFLSLAGAATDSPAKPTGCENNLGSPILNFCEVTPGILWRGSRPDKEGAAWLIQQGVRTIVNLELLHDDQQTFEQVRLDKKGRYLIDYYRIRDWEPLPAIAKGLTDDYVAKFLAIVQAAPKPVYVHCRSGENRTGLMVAAYRVIVEGENNDGAIEAAIHEMERHRGFWFKADASYISGLTLERREKIRREARQLSSTLKEDARFVCDAGKCVIAR